MYLYDMTAEASGRGHFRQLPVDDSGRINGELLQH